MIENHVVNLGLSKKLHELGIIKDSVFIYNYPDDSPLFRRIYDDKGKDIVSAYLATELLEILPDRIKFNGIITFLEIDRPQGEFRISYCYGGNFYHEKTEFNLQNALAKMLIHLVENKLMET